MPRSHPLPPDKRRAQLLAAARSVFASRGYHGTSVTHITEAAGVARGTFYNYFDSKRAIFQAVLDELMVNVNDVVVAIDVNEPIPPQVNLNLQILIETLTDHEVSRILFAEAAGLDEEGDVALRNFYRQATERIERALRTGQTMGIVRDGDLKLTAQMLLGVLKQPIFIASLEGAPIDATRFVNEFYALLAGGVLR
ncbi:MAG: TetR/AcrR family transcriptional regulator [Myxococcota bacterium]